MSIKETLDPVSFAYKTIFGEKGIGRLLLEYKLLQALRQRLSKTGDQTGVLHALKSSLERRIDP